MQQFHVSLLQLGNHADSALLPSQLVAKRNCIGMSKVVSEFWFTVASLHSMKHFWTQIAADL